MNASAQSIQQDPLRRPRDAREVLADAVVREWLIQASPPDLLLRQSRRDDGYALIVPRSRGERMLTVPALNEADILYHGNPDTDIEGLAHFIHEALDESGADHLRLPLFSRSQAQALTKALEVRLRDWKIDFGLSAVSPVLDVRHGAKKGRSSLRRAVRRAAADGFVVEFAAEYPETEIRTLHETRWGTNRGDSFFGMLRALVESEVAELATARSRGGELVALQLDIVGDLARHSYYALSDPNAAPGCGTAVLGLNWQRFVENDMQYVYSFGRGSERYKYQYANAIREHYEIRGFLAPPVASSYGS